MIYIAGVDEVGRGPLAGPVVTAAVILETAIPGIADSKKLTPEKRVKLAVLIKQYALCYAYGRAEVHEIDELNIHHATLLAMKRSVENLPVRPDKVLVDGIFKPRIDIPCEAIAQGDDSVYQIAAASILAKVARDEEMRLMEIQYPGYGFAQHKGYATAFHKQALLSLGPCVLHRKSYAPVKEAALS